MTELLMERVRDNLPPCPRDGSERIDRVAVYKDGIVYSMPRPARHHSVAHAMHHKGIDPLGAEEGFVTSAGRWVRRKPALELARRAKQILRETAPAHGLFSEDVW